MNLEPHRSGDPGAGTVLVLTEPGDTTADLVVTELVHRGARVFRMDTGDFPLTVGVSAWFDGTWHGEIHSPDGVLDLRDVRSVYCRRPTAFTFPSSMTDAERRFAAREARRGIGGLLMSLPCRWVNHPSRVADAEYKPYQYTVAAACGLEVPRTVITNIPDAADQHTAHLGSEVVYKTLASATIPDGDRVKLIYTTAVTAADMADSRVALTAHQFQQRVPKQRDVRAIVVGNRVYAANILIDETSRATAHATSQPAADATSQAGGGLLDWRADYDALLYEPTTLPRQVETGLLRMTDRLGLSFAASDFLVEPGGRHVFVDLNPNGQWGWIQEATSLPIAAALAAELLGEDL
jgi:ATP-grasp ribosomal peptide maturase